MSAEALSARLAQAGFIAAEEEAEELLAAAAGDADLLEALLQRRLTGEPLAWITGSAQFYGLTLRIAPGVYVPRWHSELVAERAIAALPEDGVAVDLCTGSGALALALARARPRARVLATDLDPRAVACARSNGVDAHEGDLFAPLDLAPASVDVVTGVVPYVPSGELHLLQRDTFTFEAPLAYDGGADGLEVLRRAVTGARAVLRPGGALVLELGGDEAERLDLDGFAAVRALTDEDGDVRGLWATYSP